MKAAELLSAASLPGFLFTFWFVPSWLGGSLEVCFTSMFIGQMLWCYCAWKAGQDEHDAKAERERRWNQHVDKVGRARRAEQWAG